LKIPFFPSIGAGDPSSVVNLALNELGLNEDFIIQVLVAKGRATKPISGGLDFFRMSSGDWFLTCERLHLPVDSISFGYSRIDHRSRVGEAILNGTFALPLTFRTRALFREYITSLET
jgi:hypothetical protein